MTGRRLTAVASAVAAALGAPHALAQSIGSSGGPLDLGRPAPPNREGVHLHDGLYVRYSLGLAYVAAAGRAGAGSVLFDGPGLGEVLAIGGTPAPGLVVAGAAIAHIAAPTVSGSQTIVESGNYGVLVDWFPDPGGGWHVGGCVGLGAVVYGDARGYSVGASVLGGYDAWVGEQWSVGLQVVATSAPTMSMLDAGAAGPTELMPVAVAIEASVLSH